MMGYYDLKTQHVIKVSTRRIYRERLGSEPSFPGRSFVYFLGRDLRELFDIE